MSTAASDQNNLQSEREQFAAEQAKFQAELKAFREQQEKFQRQQQASPAAVTPEEPVSEVPVSEVPVSEVPVSAVPVPPVPAPQPVAAAPVETPAAGPASEEEMELRSELANLFGIDTAPIDYSAADSAETSVPETVEPIPAEPVADLPEPIAEPATVLAPPASAPEPEPVPDVPQDVESDDYMQAYMANLLARSRNSASAAAPAPAPKPQPKPAPTPAAPQTAAPVAEAPQSAPAQPSVSSYEAYKRMAGGNETPVAPTTTPEAVTETELARADRPRIDRDFARAQRDSLREVASRSAQAHVASHAWKKNRPQVVMQTGLMLTGFIVGGIVLFADYMNLVDAYEVAALCFGFGLVGASMLIRRMQMIRRMKFQAYREASKAVQGSQDAGAKQEEPQFVLTDIDNYLD